MHEHIDYTYSLTMTTQSYMEGISISPSVQHLREESLLSETLCDVDVRVADIRHHIPPGRTRAPFLRYFRFNLPRMTKAGLLVLMAALAGCATAVAVYAQPLFPASDLVLGVVAGAAALFVLLGLVSRWRIWDFGMVPALGALLTYAGGLMGHAPFVWNGADIYLAATWNVLMLLALAYVALWWALGYGMLVAYPDDQGFQD